MSFFNYKETIEEGDTAILYLGVNSMHAINVVPTIKNKKEEVIENVFQTNFGALKVRNLIGVKYGSRVQLSKGWGYVLQSNPQFWTETLPHRTQIIYTPDISMILFQLNIKPGSIVVESGTGSGSFSHYIINAVKPSGHLYTFDFHENRVQQAKEEFERHGLKELVSVYHRDVCQNGFSPEVCGKADAIFLDLPAPHVAVPHATKAFKHSGGRFCSFSPCIEQSQRCCVALQENGFIEIQSMEILQIKNIVKTKSVPVMDLECLSKMKEKEELDLNKDKKMCKEVKKYLVSSAPQKMTGHTGFLTFATFPPAFTR